MEKSITGRDRMEAAFKGEKLDRIPIFFLLGSHYAEKAGYTLQQCLTDPEAALQTAKVTCKDLDPDILFVPFNPWLPDVQEALRQLMGKVPSIKRDDIKEKLPKWHVRDAKADKQFSMHLEVCKKTVEMFPEVHLETLIGGPWSFAMELRGAMETMKDIYYDKQFLHELMKFTTETAIVGSLSVLELGITPFIGDPSAGMSMISPTVYREFVLPYHQQLVEAVHDKGGRIVFHICGHVDPIMEDLLSLGVDGLSIDAPSSLKKLFVVGRGKTTIIGNIDPILFVERTFDQLEEKVKECLEIAGGDPKYVIAPGCQIPLTAPQENIKHFINCCHQYGAY